MGFLPGLKRGVLTLDMIKAEAKQEVLSNDKVMQLDEERLELRVKIAKISTRKFWGKKSYLTMHDPTDSS